MESRTIKILAIDDNPDNLITLKALIKEAFPDSLIFTALNGTRGLELASAENPDVILLDIVMPGMDGFDLCQLLKADKYLCNIPVMFITAIKGDKMSRIHALEVGAEAFLSKPIDETELTAQIRAMVKIKIANSEKYAEKERLTALVAEQTREMRETITATLNLLEDLSRENEARKKTEEALILAKEHAEESDRLKSAFLANMSHEIRTPMNGILGFAELLKEPNLTGKEQQDYIRIIEKSGARMLNIINDIVSISKIESGQLDVYISETNVNEQIEYIYEFFLPEVEQKGIQMFIDLSLPSEEAITKTDCEKIYAILTNLVKNAIKYCDKGTIELGYKLKDKYLEFFVKDTGIGIPKGRQEAVFARFVQADIADKRALQGAGLGLSISKAYVEILGGKIWVESEEGKGSIFYFTIPYDQHPAEKKVVTNLFSYPVAEPQLHKLKILIAEDDEASELFITIAVKIFGNDILTARTGFETVEICHNNPDIDLILMDIKMPGMNGYEATRQIRQFNKDVVIIAQTAFGLIGDREKSIEAGCNDYIAKPLQKNDLMNLVNRYFNLRIQ